MNNEFKKIKTQNETRYILETASAGATSSGSVATAPSNLGALRHRLEELKAKLSVPRAKPRNPVGMGSTQGRGTQKHQPNQRQTARDEKKMQGVAEGLPGSSQIYDQIESLREKLNNTSDPDERRFYIKKIKNLEHKLHSTDDPFDIDDPAPIGRQGVAEGSEIKIPTEDGIGWQDIRLLAGEGKLTQKTIKQAIEIIRKQRKQKQGVAEAGMPSSVIKSKQRYSQMTPAEFAQAHKDKSDDELISMAWRHGYGKGSKHYVDKRNKGKQGVAEGPKDTKPGWMLRQMRDRKDPAFQKIADKQAAMAALKQPSKNKQQGVAEGPLNELSKDTLKSYTKKANDEVNAIKKKQADHPRGHISGADADKKLNRQIGINQATKRIVKKDLTGVAEGYREFDELRDRIERILIKAYDRYGNRDEVINAAKPAAMKAAQELGAEKYFDEVWRLALSSHDVDTNFGDDDDGFDYTDYSMRKGERGMEEEIGHDQVSPKQARYILRLAQDHSIEQILDDFPELFRMMSIIAGERGLDLDDNWDDVVEILLNDLEDIVQQDNDQNYNDDDMREGSWGNFNSSDEQWGIDTDRYTGYRGVGGHRRREPDEQLPKSSMPSKRGMYFYNVKPGQEQLAQQAGLTQSKSGKWYSKSKIDSVEKQFGPGKYWEPKSESTLTELEKPSGTMFLKFREKQTPEDEPVVYGYGGFGTTPKDVKVSNALIKPFPIVDSYDVINKIEKIFKDKDFIGIEKIVLDIPSSLEGTLHDVIDYAEQDPERFDFYTDTSDDEPEVRTSGKVIGYGPDGKRINREPAKAQVGGSSRGVANTGMVTVQADSTGQKLINGLLSQGKLSRDTKVQGNKITLRKDDYSKMLAVLGNARFQQMFSKTGNVTENDKPDHEISMASSELASITKDAAELLDLVKQRSEEEGLEAWQQSKITKAADYMNSVLRSISSDQELDVNEDPVSDFLSKGGSITYGKYKNPRKSEKTDYGSKHIGGQRDAVAGKASQTLGRSANTNFKGLGKPVVSVEEDLRDPKDNPCWKGYKPVGTKKKNGRTVPNCVPKNEDTYISKLDAMLEQLKKN